MAEYDRRLREALIGRRRHQSKGAGRAWMMPAGVKVEEITVGTGALAARGTMMTIHYRGVLYGGEPFRSSYEDDRPLRYSWVGGRSSRVWSAALLACAWAADDAS